MTTATVQEFNRRAWLENTLKGQPDAIRAELRKIHADEQANKGRMLADRFLCEHIDRYKGRIPDDATDRDVTAWADYFAGQCKRGMVDMPDMLAYTVGHRICQGAGIEPPRPDDPADPQALRGCIWRLKCERWWRSQVRKAFGRRVEQSARALGIVRKRRAVYISADGWDRWCEREANSRRALHEQIAVCEQTGEYLNLAEIAAAGVSNPRVRRAELMTRIRGLEDCAERRGDEALFITWTLEPEMHAAHVSGERGKGAHVTPREGQAELRRRWARARAKLKREEIPVYGLRVAEPHHDGTPHWHLLLFMRPGHAERVERVLRTYVMDGDTRPHRVKNGMDCVAIDRSRGSATGYVAKYVSKSIDGIALDGALTRDADGGQTDLNLDAGDAALRARAWASTWGIRQFQFIGAPPVTVWRELRRLEPISEYRMTHSHGDALRQTERLRHAADAGDWAGYVELMGGPGASRAEHPARVRYLNDAGVGRYGDPQKRIYVESYGRVIWTRPFTWSIEHRPKGSTRRAAGVDRIEVAIGTPEGVSEAGIARIAVAFEREWHSRGGVAGAPWTRGNNCTPVATYERKHWPENPAGFTGRDPTHLPQRGGNERRTH